MRSMSLRLNDGLEKLRVQAFEYDRDIKVSTAWVEEHTIRLEACKQYLQICDEGKDFLIFVARQKRGKTIERVEKSVTMALRSVMEDPTMEFRVGLVERRGALEADFKVAWQERGGELEEDLMNLGGSVVDVAAACLQVVFLLAEVPHRRNILTLDEPGKALSSYRRGRLASYLKMLSSSLGVQMIIVTHDDEVKAIANRNLHMKKTPTGVRVKTTDFE